MSETASSMFSDDRRIREPGRMIGVLLDVSGSMRQAYALSDRSKDTTVQRVNTILTSIINIVREDGGNLPQKKGHIFTVVFGLKAQKYCDLIAVLDKIAGPEEARKKQPHDALAEIAFHNGVFHAEDWIRKHLTPDDAKKLLRVLSFDESFIPMLIELIPSRRSVSAFTVDALEFFKFTTIHRGLVHRSEAYTFAQQLIRDEKKIITKALKKVEQANPYNIEYVANLIDDLHLQDTDKPDQSDRETGWDSHDPAEDNQTVHDPAEDNQTLHDKIQTIIDKITPYLYGGTPMRDAMGEAEGLFDLHSISVQEMFRSTSNESSSRVLFVLSDGQSTDGDPLPIAQKLKDEKDVTIVTCFITDQESTNSRALYDRESPDWSEGERTLFQMSSSMANFEPPITYLIDAGWTLPLSGESRLFVQANSLEVVDEICDLVVRNLGHNCDAIIDAIGKVELANMINSGIDSLTAWEQEGDTCYANAIASVYNLAMHRIVGRESGYPEFEHICEHLIERGSDGRPKAVKTYKAIEKSCGFYRLECNDPLHVYTDEDKARKALNEKRPLVARFAWSEEEKTRFEKFFADNPNGILMEKDFLRDGTNRGGHAVVLVRCAPKYLLFMNSWGEKWGNEGFFKLENSKVLRNMKFFDVHWNEADLTDREKQAFQDESIAISKEQAKKFPSIMKLPLQCPRCDRISRIGEFEGHLLKAKCPKCCQTFEPKNEDLAKTLYLKST